MDNALLHASVHEPEYKIEERVTLALSHARLYLSESYDEQYEKSDASDTFDISCGDGGSSSSISVITFSALATYDVVCS